MIGKYTLEIGQKSDGTNDFVKGMSTGPATPDGGFSNETNACNIMTVPGVLYQQSDITDKTGTLSGVIVAACPDPYFLNSSNIGLPTGNDHYFLTDTGKFYTWNGTSMTLKRTAALNTSTYNLGNSYIISYQGLDATSRVFATNSTDIVMWTVDSAFNEQWGSVTQTQSLTVGARHPMIVYNNTLYFMDKNLVHAWNGTTFTKSILTLSPEYNIIACGVDPGSGKMMLSVTGGANASDTKHSNSSIFLWDGIEPTVPSKRIPVDDQITAFHNNSGTVYVFYGNNMGYFNGTGITFLHKLKNVTFSNDMLPYVYKVASSGGTIYVVDGTQILAYGEIMGEQKKVFRYIYTNQAASSSSETRESTKWRINES